MWYKAQKVQKYALISQPQALQILKNDNEVENWSLSTFFLAVRYLHKYIWKFGKKCMARMKGSCAKQFLIKHFKNACNLVG